MKQVFFSSSSGSPNTHEWHAWRAQGIGGSDAGPIAAAHGLIEQKAPWMPSLTRLWEEKTGRRSGPKINSAMRRGMDGEEDAREAFEAETGLPVSPVFGEMDEHPVIRASLDGISFDGDTICEIKCPSRKVHALAEQGEIVGYYLPQLAHQAMVVWGHPEAWRPEHTIMFYSFVPETGQGALVERKALDLRQMAETLLPHELEFWRMVERNVPPAGNAFLEAAAKWSALMAEKDEIEALLEEARSDIIALLQQSGQTKLEGGGVSVSRTTIKGRINYDKLFAEFAIPAEQVERFRGPATHTFTVRRLRAKQE